MSSQSRYIVRIIGVGVYEFDDLGRKDAFVEHVKDSGKADVIVEDLYRNDREGGFGKPLDTLI